MFDCFFPTNILGYDQPEWIRIGIYAVTYWGILLANNQNGNILVYVYYQQCDIDWLCFNMVDIGYPKMAIVGYWVTCCNFNWMMITNLYIYIYIKQLNLGVPNFETVPYPQLNQGLFWFPTADGCAPGPSSPVCVPWLINTQQQCLPTNKSKPSNHQKLISVEILIEIIQIPICNVV